MKKITILCLFLAALHARADLVLVQHLEGNGQDMGSVTIKAKGDKARVDNSFTPISKIIDLNSGDFITLSHKAKTFRKTSAESLRAKVEETNAKNKNKETPKVVYTGTKEKVGDFNTEIYTAEVPSSESIPVKYTFWVTKDIPDYADNAKLWKKLQSMRDKLDSQHRPDVTLLDGVVVKVQVQAGDKIATATVTSFKTESVPDSEFTPPADYKEAVPSPTPASEKSPETSGSSAKPKQ